MLKIRFLLFGGILLGCESSGDETLEAAVQEAALRWAFANAETNLDPPAAHCVAVSADLLSEGEDPDPAFLARFRDDGVPVRPLSDCRFEGGSVNNVVDNESDRHALFFTVSPPRWLGAGLAEVASGYLQGGLWGAGWECDLENSAAGWTVTDCRRVLDV